jgi:uncharacterized protein (TIGR03435 family)
VRFTDGTSRSPTLTVLTKIEGGPAWLNSDQYTIEAESEAPATNPTKAGPMMQRLLEDRFQLKVHREMREGPIYELTLAKGGSKLQPARQGPCVAADFAGSPIPFPEQGPADADTQCHIMWSVRKGPNLIRVARSANMEEFAVGLIGTVDRLVVDKTGIPGNVDYRLIFAPDESTPNVVAAATDGAPVAEDPVGPSIFTALEEQLGLKLEPARGSREYLVIDSVSRPSEN